LLTAALEDVGLASIGYTVTVIDTQADADRRHFLGSPTFSVDGQDLFPKRAATPLFRAASTRAREGFRSFAT
jgi:hypothetical protein